MAGAWKTAGCASDNSAPWISPQTTIWVTSASWSYDISNSSWTQSANYRVRAKSYDKAGNWDITYSTATFKFDTLAPVSTVTYPVDGSHLNFSVWKTITLTGTSYDADSGVNAIDLKVRKSNGDYWTGLAWQPTPPTVQLTGNPWTKLIDQAIFYIDGERYTVETNATDIAANPEGYGLKATFVYDVTNPTSAISYPYDNGYISQTGKINGGAYDTPNGITQNVFVRIQQLTGPKAGHYYKAASSSWTVTGAPAVWNQISSTAALDGVLSPSATWWQLSAAPWQTGETYEMNAYARDKAGNYQLVYATATNIKADFTRRFPPSRIPCTA